MMESTDFCSGIFCSGISRFFETGRHPAATTGIITIAYVALAACSHEFGINLDQRLFNEQGSRTL